MKKPEIDFEKLRAGKDVICPKCKTGIFRTEHDPKTTHYFKCDKCGMMVMVWKLFLISNFSDWIIYVIAYIKTRQKILFQRLVLLKIKLDESDSLK